MEMDNNNLEARFRKYSSPDSIKIIDAGLEKVSIGKVRIVEFHVVAIIFNMLLHHGAITISIKTIVKFHSALYFLDLCPFSDDSDLQDIKRSF